MKTFEELGLSREFVSVLEKAKITTPSEIQEKTIPLVLAGRDVIGGSATGSGKTLAFASSIVENLEKSGRVQALILTPTRELAEQVSNSIADFSRHKKLKTLAVYGGVNIERQIRSLRDTDVVVGTPGRILDHLNRRTIDFGNVKFLVLDEVDRMFDMGFQVDVEKILKKCPKDRQTMLFSATISSEMDHLSEKYTKNPAEVSVESHVDASKLKQVYYDVPNGLKFSLFVQLLKKEKAKLVMVFCATRRNVDFVTNNLRNMGIMAKAIHGGLVQNKRSKVLNEFNSEEGVRVLVCTDVAARGLDIQSVSHVYNYDLPKTSDEYIHRIGRTARAGKDGIAISILSSRDYENFSEIQRDKKLNISNVALPRIEKVGIIMEEQRGRRGFGNRSSRDGNRNFNRGGDRPQRNNFSRPRSGGHQGGARTSQRSYGSQHRPRDNNRSFNRGRSNSFGNQSPRGRSNGPRGAARRTPNRGMQGQRSNSFGNPRSRESRDGRPQHRGSRNNSGRPNDNGSRGRSFGNRKPSFGRRPNMSNKNNNQRSGRR
ncbi:DEAD/DEAH box helicase [Candidatus Pacearchaeota archaeon]|nr:DEAD/DEAH box helicase [Candidatus Pacearchaeota archaeon]